MKKLIYYAILMVAVIILLPLFIVRSCSIEEDNIDINYKSTEKHEVMIKVLKGSEGKVEEMNLEEYVKGVVAAEMPAEFDLEALKAQAVAARTYAYVRKIKGFKDKEDVHKGAHICTDSTCCQAWISRQEALGKWDVLLAEEYWSKIEKAVNETKDVIIVYNNTVANPVFHSNSGGRTENAEEVWEGSLVPYLVSVPSSGEEDSKSFENVIYVKTKDFISTLKNEYPEIEFNGEDILKDIKIADYTTGERVKTIQICGIDIKGTDFRKLFLLKSTNFNIEKEDEETLKITTLGNGHGVGMSQWGANYLAEEGETFENILKYYYTGITLEKIENFEIEHQVQECQQNS